MEFPATTFTNWQQPAEAQARQGGARAGAGRKPRKWASARGLHILPASAAEILERAGERRIWYRLLDSQDESIVLRAMMYLTDRRDGRPAQSINVTSTSLTLNARDIESARQIVAEIRGEPIPRLSADSEAHLPADDQHPEYTLADDQNG